MKKEVLGIKIDDITMKDALKTVEGWLSRPGKRYIVTPNPEIVMMAQKDEQLKEIINKADLAIPDGKGLRLTTDIVCNIAGVDFIEELVKLAHEKGLTTGFLGGRDRVAERCAERLRSRYPNLKVSFAGGNMEVDEEGRISHTTNYILPATDLLFVAFGPPKQEKWIAENLDKIDVKVAMGVGGAFDYLSGQVPRAPKWLREFNLEWLFRLIIQPWRIKRQLALIKYVWLLLTS